MQQISLMSPDRPFSTQWFVSLLVPESLFQGSCHVNHLITAIFRMRIVAKGMDLTTKLNSLRL